MRVEEAAWIRDRLSEIPDVSPVVELGSSTLQFRTVSQPHIDRMIHAPLRARGVKVVHADIKAAPGVDVAGDILDPAVRAQLRAFRPRVLLCCNMLEHVEDRAVLAAACEDLLEPGGHLIVTVPHSYPHHKDPIDTGYRPTPAQLARLFPRLELVRSCVVESDTYWHELRRRPRQLPRILLVRLYLLAKVWIDRSAYADANHRLLWLFRRYKQSCVVLRKPAGG